MRSLLEMLRAIDSGDAPPADTADLADRLGWPLPPVVEALREARMRGLVTGTVRRRATVEIENIRLTRTASALLRQADALR